MKFDDLDLKMRVYETSHDRCVLPNMYIVARIDGRSFTKLTKEVHKFNAPFDERFRDLMVETVKHLMNCGFNVIYGYTESDEISLLFNHNETAFGRKTRKFISILAGEASAKFSSLLGDVGAFDCRLSELPNKQLVQDYFRWRNEDAHRNALNAHCYWRLRKDNLSQGEATSKIEGLSIAAKNELLYQYGINFNELPNWQKRGIGVYWKDVKKEGFNPKTNQTVLVDKRELYTDFELPMRDDYNQFVKTLMEKHEDPIVI
ncbi:guanylyltransferase [Niastella yeongjuensis]|uniref:tRNA(His) guanylyltransferase n=1 Tax=Niastella yeongjuensis TaxID=354355 RepID=A0A1V9EN49_9BACT|nr:tRNA(His) guanylyltransferase Thg1 family protein [Niastella yeongjuensis]OQP47462.1 guanylyltransferase [Niastella yeongjuensis]SEN85443.1 tRNA(His) 5'-end guanylyltransferase [Niastella yeongjuensis]